MGPSEETLMDLILGIPRMMLGSMEHSSSTSHSFSITDILGKQLFIRSRAKNPGMLDSLATCSLGGSPVGFLLHAGVVRMAYHYSMNPTIMPEFPTFTCPELST